MLVLHRAGFCSPSFVTLHFCTRSTDMGAFSLLPALAGLLGLAAGQYLTNGTFSTEGQYSARYDTGAFGPEVEEFHYFFDQWHAFNFHMTSNVVYTSCV